MFQKEIYIERRNKLRKEITSGIAVLLGNQDVSFNYPANIYSFRQDSSFLYFFGIDHPNFAGVVDIENNTDYIFGNDVDMDDIIWMGNQPSVAEQAAEVGVNNTLPFSKLADFLQTALSKQRKIHFLPPYRGENKILLEKLLGINSNFVKNYASEELIKAVVKLRSVKEDIEIQEINKAVDTAYLMHTTAMKMAKAGVVEREIAGRIEGIALANGGAVSFPVILSINGQTLHNHYHENTLREGRMMVTDAGAETPLHYASDITRTVPVGGKFNQRQREIYEIVLKAETEAIKAIKPNIAYADVHRMAAKIIANGLKDLGLMKGNIDQAVEQGAHALFFPHGLGHMMGLDVHDMENVGENYVGYNAEIQRSTQFGLAFLRLGRKLQKGFVLTVEPGLYFIPALIELWKSENKFEEFINYQKVETYKDFGGIRIEDDVLVTENSYKVLGSKPIPKTVSEIEETMKQITTL